MANLIFNNFDKNKIIEVLNKNNISVENNYLIVTKHRTVMEGITKLFINSTYNAIDASLQYLLVFSRDTIYEVKISGDLLEFLDRKDIKFNKYQHNEIKDFNIAKNLTKYIISWKVEDKNYSYEVDKFQGIYSFVKENFAYLQKIIFILTRIK